VQSQKQNAADSTQLETMAGVATPEVTAASPNYGTTSVTVRPVAIDDGIHCHCHAASSPQHPPATFKLDKDNLELPYPPPALSFQPQSVIPAAARPVFGQQQNRSQNGLLPRRLTFPVIISGIRDLVVLDEGGGWKRG